MTKSKSKPKKPKASRDREHVLSAGIPLGSVLLVLLVGAVLRVDPVARDLIVAHAGDPVPRAVAALEDVALRATRDVERLETRAGEHALQLAMLCDAASVARTIEPYSTDERLFVVAVDRDDQLCFRILWGTYPDADAARAARDVPSGGRAFPKPVAEVLR